MVVLSTIGVGYSKVVFIYLFIKLFSTINTNLLSSFWTTKIFLPDMVKNNRGHIVSI